MTTLFAPISGVLVALDDVPDQAFAQRLAGDGLAIDPLDQRLVAPCDARVLQVHRAGHAVTLSGGGVDILIHIGLDTVKLNGKGFSSSVKAGDQVRAGDPLMSFDADFIARHARSLLSPLLVTNMDQVASLQPRRGKVIAGRDVVAEVVIGARAEPEAARHEGQSVSSGPIAVAGD